jgi:predicted phosphohydrolase
MYEEKLNQIFVDIVEAKEWNDIVLIQGSNDWDMDYLENLRQFCQTNLPDKKVAILPAGVEISIYGIREEIEDDRSTSSEL